MHILQLLSHFVGIFGQRNNYAYTGIISVQSSQELYRVKKGRTFGYHCWKGKCDGSQNGSGLFTSLAVQLSVGIPAGDVNEMRKQDLPMDFSLISLWLGCK